MYFVRRSFFLLLFLFVFEFASGQSKSLPSSEPSTSDESIVTSILITPTIAPLLDADLLTSEDLSDEEKLEIVYRENSFSPEDIAEGEALLEPLPRKAIDLPAHPLYSDLGSARAAPDSDEVLRRDLIQFLRRQISLQKRADLKSEVYIPLAPSERNLLHRLDELSSKEIRLFLKKKSIFLVQTAKVLRKFVPSILLVNKSIAWINDHYFDFAVVVTRDKYKWEPIRIGIPSIGFSLPKLWINYLEKTRFKKYIPKSGGFLFLAAGGFTFAREMTSHRKSKWTIDFFADFETLKESTTGMISASIISGGLGVVYEERSFKQYKQQFVTEVNRAGSPRYGEGFYGLSKGFGRGLPGTLSGIPVDLLTYFYDYKTNVSRYYFLEISGDGIRSELFRKLFEKVKSLLRLKFGAISVGNCHGALL